MMSLLQNFKTRYRTVSKMGILYNERNNESGNSQHPLRPSDVSRAGLNSSRPVKKTNCCRSERSHTIRELLYLNHFNKEEAEYIDKVIDKHNDLFRLPDEPLGYTNVIMHKITIINNRLISTKQYRFPKCKD